MSDPIADMLTRVRNAQERSRRTVIMKDTKVKVAIAKVLKEEGYINNYEIEEVDGHRQLVLELKYHQGRSVIESIRRASRPGLRLYCSKDKLPRVLGGMGIAVVSTSKGIMSDAKARLIGEGGEILCYVS